MVNQLAKDCAVNRLTTFSRLKLPALGRLIHFFFSRGTQKLGLCGGKRLSVMGWVGKIGTSSRCFFVFLYWCSTQVFLHVYILKNDNKIVKIE